MVDPVKCYNFYISYNLTQMVNFPTRISDCDSHSPALLDFFLPTLVFVQCLSLHWVILIMLLSVFIDFPNSQRDAPFHRIAYDYSRTDWDGLCYHLSEVSWEDIFKLSVSAAANKFCEWVQVGIDAYISIMVSIRSSLTHLHGFQLLVLCCSHSS